MRKLWEGWLWTHNYSSSVDNPLAETVLWTIYNQVTFAWCYWCSLSHIIWCLFLALPLNYWNLKDEHSKFIYSWRLSLLSSIYTLLKSYANTTDCFLKIINFITRNSMDSERRNQWQALDQLHWTYYLFSWYRWINNNKMTCPSIQYIWRSQIYT